MVVRSIQDVKNQVRLEEIIQQRGVTLRPTQGEERLEGHCPFHIYDSTPRFHVYIQSQRYHCFGCGAHGDVIDFVQAFDLCSCQEALARVSGNIRPLVTQKLLNSRIPRRVLPVPFPMPKPETLAYQRVLAHVHQHYRDSLLDNYRLRDRLYRERGITKEGVLLCHLGHVDGSLSGGWAPEEEALLSTIGIFNTRQRERLYGRIIIPEWHQASCTWMIGRQFQPFQEKTWLSAHEPPKYLGLSLRKPLLGYGKALSQLKKKTLIQAILVVEGAIDYILAIQWHLPVLCVALIGTHASQHQCASMIDLQQRAGNVPILLSLDADDAGRQASHQMYQRLLQLHRPAVEMASIEDAKDIGDLGIRPHGELLVLAAIEHVLGSLTKGKQS